MKKRPTPKKKPSAQVRANSTPQQASLPGIERANGAPLMPTPNTRAAEALALLVQHGHLDQREFLDDCGGWRLAAAVHVLRGLGWPIETVRIAVTLANGEDAHIARYVLDRAATRRQAGFITPELFVWLTIGTPLVAAALALLARWFA